MCDMMAPFSHIYHCSVWIQRFYFNTQIHPFETIHLYYFLGDIVWIALFQDTQNYIFVHFVNSY